MATSVSDYVLPYISSCSALGPPHFGVLCVRLEPLLPRPLAHPPRTEYAGHSELAHLAYVPALVVEEKNLVIRHARLGSRV